MQTKQSQKVNKNYIYLSLVQTVLINWMIGK